jgi:hypothetical protein
MRRRLVRRGNGASPLAAPLSGSSTGDRAYRPCRGQILEGARVAVTDADEDTGQDADYVVGYVVGWRPAGSPDGAVSGGAERTILR